MNEKDFSKTSVLEQDTKEIIAAFVAHPDIVHILADQKTLVKKSYDLLMNLPTVSRSTKHHYMEDPDAFAKVMSQVCNGLRDFYLKQIVDQEIKVDQEKKKALHQKPTFIQVLWEGLKRFLET